MEVNRKRSCATGGWNIFGVSRRQSFSGAKVKRQCVLCQTTRQGNGFTVTFRTATQRALIGVLFSIRYVECTECSKFDINRGLTELSDISDSWK